MRGIRSLWILGLALRRFSQLRNRDRRSDTEGDDGPFISASTGRKRVGYMKCVFRDIRNGKVRRLDAGLAAFG